METKSNRIEFESGDMGSIDLPPESFEAIISIDTFYFVADKKALLWNA